MKRDNRCRQTPYEADSFKIFNSGEKYYIRRCKKCRKLIKQPVVCMPLYTLEFVTVILLYYFTEISFSSFALIVFCLTYVINALLRILPWREVRENELEHYDGDASLYFKEKQSKYENWVRGIVYLVLMVIILRPFF